MKNFLLIIFCLIFAPIRGQNNNLPDDGRTIKIPVVFHISKSIINKEIILQELNELNKNYSATNSMDSLHADFRQLIGNPNIKFHLANVQLNYSPLKGVKRYNGGIRRLRAKLIKRFGSDSIIHIIVGKLGSVSKVLLSKNHPKSIKIRSSSFGNSSNTVTHEMGHALGLWHVWGNTNCKENKRGSVQTDYIEDTPFQENCTDQPRKKPCSAINNIKDRPNYNNFMDYSGCRCFFTKDQAKAIRRKIISYRRNLYEMSQVN
ncbi:M43 family zinc metalloprotease [Polaribacter sp.]|uniref:M43 family zinc metalloprotease n=1 Tax=Polaribacter sp. TaxID=1920175 RepID=UPI003EF5A4EF